MPDQTTDAAITLTDEQVQKKLDAIATPVIKKAVDDLTQTFNDMTAKVDVMLKDLAKARTAAEPPPVPVLKAQPKRHGSLKAFKGEDGPQKAHGFGAWLGAQLFNNPHCMEVCKGHSIPIVSKTMTEAVNTAGGFLVPEQFLNDLIDLREQYGMARKYCRVIPMASDTLTQPKYNSGVTVYWVGEGSTITASDMSVTQVRLVARKLAALTKVSTELQDDSLVAIGDMIANNMAWSFAKKEDECLLNGDGTSTYGGILGLYGAIARDVQTLGGAMPTNNAYSPAVKRMTGNLMSEQAIGDFTTALGQILDIADGPGTIWLTSRVFFANVMERLAIAAGGATVENYEGGLRRSFLGYPVVLNAAFPRADVDSSIWAVFGDLSQAVTFGSRREMAVSLSEHADFAADLIDIKATERFDILVHNIGKAHATAASQEASPIVTLWSIT